MVLDALIHIKSTIDASLTFRRSCREGICGSCAMNIDGVNRLACTTSLEDLGPKDCDLSVAAHACGEGPGPRPSPIFMPQYASVKPWLADTNSTAAGPGAATIERGSGRRIDRPAACILCACLFNRMPQLLVEQRAVFSGPAALLASYRWIIGQPGRGRRASGSMSWKTPFRLYRCHTIMKLH